MIVVADTSPLNYLILLGHVDVLGELYGQVIAPLAVLIEMQHLDAPPEVRAWAGDPPRWLNPMRAQKLDESLPEELGRGEREAISLALELRAGVLLIDEWRGRQEANDRHLSVAGTLAVLLQASLLGRCEFPEVVTRLRGHGFRVSATVEGLMLARYKEAKSKQS